jgi:hypothetical protein
MVPGWVPFKIVSDSPALNSRWPLLPKIEISSSPLFSIFSLAAILVGSRDHWTQIWKGDIQESFQQSLVEIGSVVSEEKIPPFKMAAVTKNRNFFKWPKLLYFKPECAQI